jgi:hypothetical protein
VVVYAARRCAVEDLYRRIDCSCREGPGIADAKASAGAVDREPNDNAILEQQ